ncbi:MAG: DUF2798 domain-containing protein [Clostridiales Family XIII bacterium]|nr:DUF2798 domain-containing protein [Clostridiales Family XIII bacterium]
MNKKQIFTSLCMALCMSLCMSLIMNIVNLGFIPYFLAAWLKSAAIGFLVALPLTFALPPLIRRIADKLKL